MRLGRGQVAVVTGAASGIGLALARRLSARGLGVVLADIEVPALEAAAGALGGGDEALAVPTDVADAEQVRALARRTLEHFGRVDVVCNNAGVFAAAGPMWEIGEADWHWTLDVNLWGVINGITTFVPHLVAQGSGHLLNTASLAGVATIPFIGPYTATKHAVVGLSESLAAELARVAPGVGVTVLCPGRVDTAIGRSPRRSAAGASGAPPGAGTGATVPPGGRGQSADEVAGLAIAAIEQDRLHDLSSPDSGPPLQRRVGRLLEDLGLSDPSARPG